MMIKVELPKIIPVFPLSNFIIFPNTTVPLNIFEPRYIEMIGDSMKTNKMIGLIQPKKNITNYVPDLHSVGCLGEITSFSDMPDGRCMIDLNGLNRFKIIKEIKNNKPYRECEISFDSFNSDSKIQEDVLKFSDLELIFKDLKSLFEKKGYIITLAMASPFSLEEKQVLLESESLETRKNKIAEILSTYSYDNFDNTTIQ
jgi:Lon protease-like protein